MSKTICLRCRATLRQTLRSKQRTITPSIRAYGSDKAESSIPPQAQNDPPNPPKDTTDIATLLSQPTWSVRSLFPPSHERSELSKQEITPSQLHHLLRLSALPQPDSPEQESEMLKTLHSQLHFVRDIQSVNTEGVEPLQSIRDETDEGIQEQTIGMEDSAVRDALRREDIKGRNRRPKRRRTVIAEEREVEEWDVLGTAGEMVEFGGGRFFVVRGGNGALKVDKKEDTTRVDTLQIDTNTANSPEINAFHNDVHKDETGNYDAAKGHEDDTVLKGLRPAGSSRGSRFFVFRNGNDATSGKYALNEDEEKGGEEDTEPARMTPLGRSNQNQYMTYRVELNNKTARERK